VPIVDYSLKTSVPLEQKILQSFLYLAIFVPNGELPPPRCIIEKPDLARYYLNWGNRDDRACFAVDEDQVLGVIWSRCFPEDDPGYGSICPDIPELSIAVLPEVRGMGIGTQLLSQFLGQLPAHYEAVSLSVHAANPAINLYQRFGFKVFQTYGQSIIMMKNFD
jgi:ribosomal protein S18 acetylase RimI-like enzyme